MTDPPPDSKDRPSKLESVKKAFAERDLKRLAPPVLIVLMILAGVLTQSINPSVGDLAKAIALFLLSGSVGVLAVAAAHMYLVADHFDKQRDDQDQRLAACLSAIQGEVADLKTDVERLTAALPSYIVDPPLMSSPDIADLANAGVLMTDDRIAAFESHESGHWDEIWVVTEDLHKDLPTKDPADLSFNSTVIANLQAGVHYVYFLPDFDWVRRYFRSGIEEKAGAGTQLTAVWLPADVWQQAPFTMGDSAIYRRGDEESAVFEVPQTKRRFWIKVDDATLVRKLRGSLHSCATVAGQSLDSAL